MSCKTQGAILVACFCLTILGFSWGRSRLVEPLRGDVLEVAAPYLDFGSVVVQEDFVWKIPIENRSTRSVEVAGMERSCGCAQVTPSAFTLGPREKRWLQVQLDLHSRGDFAFSGVQRDFAVELRPIVARAMAPGRPWRITGKVRSPFRIVESKLAFPPDALIVGSPFAPLVLTLEPRGDTQRLEVEVSEPSAAASVTFEPDGERTRIVLRPDAALAPGAYEFRLAITPRDKRGNRLPRQVLRVAGRVVEDVEIEPPFVRLSSASPTARVRMRSRTGSPFEVLDVESVEQRISVSPAPEANAFDVTLLNPADALRVEDVQFHVRTAKSNNGICDLSLQVVLLSQ